MIPLVEHCTTRVFNYIFTISTVSVNIKSLITMTDTETTDLDFNVSEKMLDPFKGSLKFTVQRKIRIAYFEFSTHDMGCRQTMGRPVKYGLKLTLNGKTLFSYHNARVDVEVNKKLILTPGNTYNLETWLGGHARLKSGKIVKSCYYHYAQVSRSDGIDYEPFEFVFAENDDNGQPSNKTCVYVISYQLID